MITIDTGPLVALFDPKDPDHKACHKILSEITTPLYTTQAVLTEVLHMLNPGSRGAKGIKEFILDEYVFLYGMTIEDVKRCFSLIDKYHDLPMDFADSTLVVLAEKMKSPNIFTLDINDFSIYRYKKGHKCYPFEIVGRELLI